jgi:hypothetical protein
VNLQTTRFKKPALTSGTKSTGLENLLSTRAFLIIREMEAYLKTALYGSEMWMGSLLKKW